MSRQIDPTQYIYFVLVEVDPDAGAGYVHWLDTKHIADVAAYPSVLWARKVILEEPATDGWQRFMVIYGFLSKKQFNEYRNSDLFKSFAGELEQFEGVYRLKRMHGSVDLAFS